MVCGVGWVDGGQVWFCLVWGASLERLRDLELVVVQGPHPWEVKACPWLVAVVGLFTAWGEVVGASLRMLMGIIGPLMGEIVPSSNSLSV